MHATEKKSSSTRSWRGDSFNRRGRRKRSASAGPNSKCRSNGNSVPAHCLPPSLLSAIIASSKSRHSLTLHRVMLELDFPAFSAVLSRISLRRSSKRNSLGELSSSLQTPSPHQLTGKGLFAGSAFRKQIASFCVTDAGRRRSLFLGRNAPASPALGHARPQSL